jgi:hypothetical protein
MDVTSSVDTDARVMMLTHSLAPIWGDDSASHNPMSTQYPAVRAGWLQALGREGGGDRRLIGSGTADLLAAPEDRTGHSRRPLVSATSSSRTLPKSIRLLASGS